MQAWWKRINYKNIADSLILQLALINTIDHMLYFVRLLLDYDLSGLAWSVW